LYVNSKDIDDADDDADEENSKISVAYERVKLLFG